MNIGVIFGDQLWEDHPILDKVDKVIMVESYDYCRQQRYHKLKLAYVFVMMREYADSLRRRGFDVEYIPLSKRTGFHDLRTLFDGSDTVCHMVTPHDKPFASMIDGIFSDCDVRMYDSIGFLTPSHFFKEWLNSKFGNKRLLMADFYKDQRRRLHILVDEQKHPIGGQWSYDVHNRNKLKKRDELPERIRNFDSVHWDEVKAQILELFPDYPGKLDHSWLPLNRPQALSYLEDFVSNSLFNFGTFEDALSDRDHLMYHSGLSSSINYGLLTPAEVIEAVLKKVQGVDFLTASGKRLLYSTEGFIRQVIGWREWIKGMYDHVYTQEVIDRNFFNATQPLPECWWDFDADHYLINDNTPLKRVFEKVDQYGYAHHIERLMVVANWMTLQGYDPKECYRWFRTSFIDAFDWVMVPNVYGMGLFSDGGVFASKPYISGGNYIKKMSDYPKGDWEWLWTQAFWKFLYEHEEYFMKQPRMAMLLKQRNNKKKEISDQI